MIIDRVSEGDSRLLDKDADVMTSPVNLCSFYGCSSPVTEPNFSTGFQSPWSPNSDSEKSRSNAGSPFPIDALNRVNAEAPQEDLRQPNRYQGVRVKNTVKELIMQKRNNEIQTHQQKNEIDFPALTTLLQGAKRPAECLSSHSVTKRPATEQNNVLSLYNPCEDIFKEHSIYDGLGDMFTSGELSIESVKVQGSQMPVFPQPQEAQDQLPTLYTTTPCPLYPGSQLPTVTESPYTSSLQGLSFQQGFGPCRPVAPPVSFFQWQIQQEEEKLANLTPADLTSRDDDGDTFLHIAVAQGRRALAYVLAKKMASIGMLDMKENNNQSAFQVSVAANQHLIAQDLLSLGAQVNTTDCWGRSPLHVCAEKGHTLTLQAIQRSIENSSQKVNVEAVDYEGLTPLHIAILSHNAVVQDLNHVLSAPQSPQAAAQMQRRKLLGECISTLLLMGACCGSKDRKSGRNALHMAAEEANVELLRLFLDEPNSLSVINAKAYNGNTALHVAAALQGRQAQSHAVQLLMRKGADPSARNLENEQPVQLVPEGPIGDQVRRILKGRSASARFCLP
ncbi:NF-kappa-B inhibitor zeta [Electrophorus electricus]|uniref:NF-kappa-B inhibitor zeta n=1 Tax=Electrophorus electricus TaxID=8005 RepID=UPI000F0A4DB0|nr:NF-kappa-B inhibitor zeta [Electrophorus electricus]